jgi:hypothetical protein
MNRIPVRGLCAAAMLLLGGAVRAEEKAAEPDLSVADRLDLVEVKQKDAVVAGDVPGSFRVPGTELSLRLYGWAELDWTHDYKGDNSDIDISTFAPYVPVRGTAGASRTGRDIITARTSRFGFDASQPTRFGALAAKIEGDFINEPRTGDTAQYGTGRNVITQQQTSSYGFRLRHAYGTFAGFLAGQTWGTFMDVDNSPETVDFNGPIGSTIIRQPMIRYTYATQFFGASRFTVALENGSSYVLRDDTSVMAESLSRFPDAVLRWDGGFEWGNASVRAITQELRVKDGAGVSATKRGYGAAATAFLKMRGGADYLSVAVTGGEGLGRYLNYTEGAIYDAARNEIAVERAIGVVAGYQLKWSPMLRVNFVYGLTRNFNNDYTSLARTAGIDTAVDGSVGGKFAINRMVQQAHIGPIFTPIPGLDVGIEGIWGQRETLAKEHGDLLRWNAMVRYYIN